MARLLLSVILLFTTASSLDQLRPESHVQSVVIGEVSPIVFKTEPQPYDILILFNTSDLTESLDILNTTVISKTGKGTLWVKGKKLTSQLVVDPIDCRVMGGNESKCPLDLEPAYVRLNIIQSRVVDWIADIVGWTYFFAWSISFYPQIFLNCSRKSVIGLNFDFLLLNVIGFTAYSIYNLLMFFNPFVQAEYQQTNPHSPNPVYLNDVVFAVHALIACLVTGAQCFFYERENQRVSKPCMGLGTILVLVGIVSGALSVFGVYNALIFVNSLSYIKMAVTMSKYFPQAFYNFRRKSTVGWSIGNILLDFTGGSLDILQMVLQSANVGDWRSFYGNPVKFGLGLVSIIFDIVFMIQHYILYRDVEVAHNEYAGIDNPEARGSVGSYGSQEVGDQPSARIMSAEE